MPALSPRWKIAALIIFGLLFSYQARAAEQVTIRAYDHGDFGRFVFDWKESVGHGIRLEGNQLTIVFDRPMEGSFAPLLQQLSHYISAARLDDDGRKAVFDLSGASTAKSFDSGNSIAIDIRHASNAAASVQSAKSDSTETETESTEKSAGKLDLLPVRFGIHDEYSRIVFDWPSAVPYTAVTDGNTLKLEFAVPARIDLDRLRADLPRFVTAMDAQTRAGGLTVTIAGTDAVHFHHFRSESKVVVDIAGSDHALLPAEGPEPKSSPADRKTAKPQPGTPAPRARVLVAELPDSPGGDRPVTASPPSAPSTSGAQSAPVRLLPDKSGSTPATTTPSSPKQPQTSSNAGVSAMPASTPVPSQMLTDQLQTAAGPEGEKTGAQIPLSPSGKPAAAAPQASLAPAMPPAGPPAKPVTVTAKTDQGAVVLSFAWDDPAAVFRRAGAIWVVLGGKAKLDISALKDWNKEFTAEEVEVPGASALRLTMGPAIAASVQRGKYLTVALSRIATHPAIAIQAAAQTGANSRLLLPVKDAGNPVTVADPEVGDKLVVVPVRNQGEGIAANHQYALFYMPATAQGIVVEPKADGLSVESRIEGVEIGGPNGLFLSAKTGMPSPDETPPDQAPVLDQGGQPPATPQVPGAQSAPAQTPAPPNAASAAPASPPPAATANPGTAANAAVANPAPANPSLAGPATDSPDYKLFDFVGWKKGDMHFNDVQTALQHAIIAAPPSGRMAARLELARFYFAYGLYPETLGILGVIAADDPNATPSADFAALRGAALYLTDDYLGAASDFGAPSLANEPEADLWRGALAASQGRWPDAVAAFAHVGDRIQDYPPDLRVKFGLLAAETAVISHEFGAADIYLGFVDQAGPDTAAKAQMKYLRGKLAEIKREPDEAAKLYDQAVNEGDPATAAKAKFAKVSMLLDAGKMQPEDAINELEALRFAWRGDSFEFDVLRKLGDLYLATEHYEKGLQTLKRAVTFFADDPRSKDAAELMNATFSKLYVDGAASKLSPLKALGLYQEFRELTPPGEAGDAVVRQLAERLAAIDLLDQAAELLEPQVTLRVRGLDKANWGARLAAIRLMNKQPDKVLTALNESVVEKMPPDLVQSRKRLEARALAALGKVPEAMAALGNDQSRDADLLRADIYWRSHNWVDAAKALGRVTEKADLSENGTLADDDAQLLLRRAAALWLADDRDGLDNLRDRAGAAIDKTKYGTDFKVIAAAEGGEADSVEAVTQRLSEIDAYAAFAADLKDKKTDTQNEPAKEVAAAAK